MKPRSFSWILLVVCLTPLVLCAAGVFLWLQAEASQIAAPEEAEEADSSIFDPAAANVLEAPPAGSVPKNQAELRRQVTKDFEARQASLRSELTQFRGRLDRLARTLEERERQKNAIIEHRIAELLNPNLRWNAETSRQEVSAKGPIDSMSSPSDYVPSKELLDTLQRRWSLVEAQFKSGNAKVGDFLKVDEEFAQARLEAARNPTERGLAYAEVLKRRAAIKELTQKLVERGEALSADLLAIETSILRTQQQAAREFQGSTDLDPLRGTKPRSQPGASMYQTSPRGTGDMRAPARRGIDESSPAHERGSAVFPSASDFQRNFTRALASGWAGAPNLSIVCAEFRAQLDLLRIDLEEAKAAYALASERYETLSKAYKAGEVPQSRVLDATSELESAKARIKRGETLLALYTSKPLMELYDMAQKAVEESEKSGLARLRELSPPLKPLDTAPDDKAATSIWQLFGATVKAVSRDALPDTRFSGGLRIVELRAEGPAAKAGLRVDDTLLGLHVWETITPQGLAFILNHSDVRPPPGTTTTPSAIVLRAIVLRGKDTPLVANVHVPFDKSPEPSPDDLEPPKP